MPATAGGSTSGSSSSVITTERPAKAPRRDDVRRGGADEEHDHERDPVDLGRDPERVAHDLRAELIDQGSERDLLEDRGDRYDEERQGGERREPRGPR